MRAQFERHSRGAQPGCERRPSSASGFTSVAVTLAPYAGAEERRGHARARESHNQHALSCEIEPGSQSLSPQFQSRQRKQRKHQRRDPKSHDDFRFAPADQLKMMMQRRHAKHALPGQLERAHLNDHGERFQHENAADRKQQNFLLDDHGDGCQSRRPARASPHRP